MIVAIFRKRKLRLSEVSGLLRFYPGWKVNGSLYMVSFHSSAPENLTSKMGKESDS